MQMRLGSSGFFVAVEEEPTRSVSTTQRCLIRIIGNDYTFNEMLFHFFMPFFFFEDLCNSLLPRDSLVDATEAYCEIRFIQVIIFIY